MTKAKLSAWSPTTASRYDIDSALVYATVAEHGELPFVVEFTDAWLKRERARKASHGNESRYLGLSRKTAVVASVGSSFSLADGIEAGPLAK